MNKFLRDIIIYYDIVYDPIQKFLIFLQKREIYHYFGIHTHRDKYC